MILLLRPYLGYVSGTIVQLSTTQEAAAIAQGFGTTSAGPVTPGAVNTTQSAGRVGIAAAGTSVVITNANVTTESKIFATLSNAAADATALYITRITPANGSFTITLNAAATAAVSVDWAILGPFGGLSTAA
ncbi:hypothetical protein UFOVP607_51 [uncultured Caudovirales phage]|uniref:Uncharacterized protein n=1 Tax=uncultured Caudovirales phage TaxID=2100421 RepID=A0A6J5N431_9CAUD|nr:hypothetical protein UFOVP607_51 [uncultured Caudovirales phage]